ncbi:uncharacterized protein dbf4b isoform X1 [Silurus meridionalis]|nr:uncharacterized protein dbf4b isoform X1 [Silurus meridionalis]
MQRAVAACEPLGPLGPGPRPLEGKSFYLDEVKSHGCTVLTRHIVRLGGKVESFLYKEVNIVITGNRDALNAAAASSGKVKGQDPPCEDRGNVVQRPGTPRAPVCGSRGKALLEKAIRNNEQSRGGVLSSAARYWGVKIVSVDQFMKVVVELNSQRSTHTHYRKEEKNSSVRVIKAGSLKLDFVKVEDSSRKYRPLHSQALEFPMLSYTRRFSPFENPAPVHPGKGKDDTLRKEMSRKSDEAISSEDKSSKAPKTSRKKKSLGFCECCHLKYRDQDQQHLQSDVHRRFVENVQNYAVVDQLVVEMDAVFLGCKDPHTDALMTRLSSDSVAPPSESKQSQSDVETCRPIQTLETASKQEPQRSDSPVLPQKPQEHLVDASHDPTLEVVDEDVNSTSNLKSCPPSPHPQEGSGLDDKPPELTGPSSGVDSHDHVPNTTRPSTGLEASLNHDRGPSICSKERQEDAPSDSCAEREQTPLVDATSCSPSFRSPPFQSLFMKLSDGVNLRKRSRSFTLSPKVSKVRRTNMWSDPTDQNSGIGFDHVQKNGQVNEVPGGQRETAEQVPLSEDRVSSPNLQQDEPLLQTPPNNRPPDPSSELGPPQLYPFFHDDLYQNHPPFLEPPTLVPVVPLPSTNPTSSTSLLSQSFSSVCIESALVPDTFSPASSESDWDSGLLTRFAPPVHLQSKGGRCELDLGFLLQSSCSGMQDGSYASRLCSVLQPTASSSHAGFGEPNTIYRPMDRRIVQGLGV